MPGPDATAPRPASHLVWHEGKVDAASRAACFGQRPATIWLTGLSGAGKSTLAYELEHALLAAGNFVYVLDGDNVRHGLNRDLGFSPDDRRENIRRIAEVARLMNDAGLIVVTAFISPYREDRRQARSIIGDERFVEAWLSAPLAACEARDPKGMYKKARRGEIPAFTGVSAPYETPERAELVIDSDRQDIATCTAQLLDYVRRRFNTPQPEGR